MSLISFMEIGKAGWEISSGAHGYGGGGCRCSAYMGGGVKGVGGGRVKGVGGGVRINFNPICRLPYNPHLPHWFRAMIIFMGALDSVPLPFSAWLGRS
jgi:hypothetical protein